ncbi:MAG: hypothetical protein MJA83_12250 [Gammaproteobacteria bacterium]|nr:hypothetical protein [Gammaproteobacteria bacterium]
MPAGSNSVDFPPDKGRIGIVIGNVDTGNLYLQFRDQNGAFADYQRVTNTNEAIQLDIFHHGKIVTEAIRFQANQNGLLFTARLYSFPWAMHVVGREYWDAKTENLPNV